MKYFLPFIIAVGILAPAWSDAKEPVSTCDILTKIREVEPELARIPLEVGTKEYSFTERRAGYVKTRKEPDMQIALALLNLDTCVTQTVMITKHADQLIAPEGYRIKVVCRANGICWNDWNTYYQVEKPGGWFVIANEYPRITDRTAKSARVITPVFYSSYSSQLYTSAMILSGVTYQQTLSQRVDDRLRIANVMSRAYPNLRVIEVPLLKPEYSARKMPIEHTDQTEFILDPQEAIDREHVIIGANGDRTSAYTCSPKGACGPRQFISGTWTLMVRTYPAAQLVKDFVKGSSDPVQSLMATRLLDDYNLAELKRGLSSTLYATVIANPHLLEEALAAAYNTGVSRVILVLKEYFAYPGKYTDWLDARGRASRAHLLAETKGYISKLRFTRDEWSSR